jgi:hypothetical protein
VECSAGPPWPTDDLDLDSYRNAGCNQRPLASDREFVLDLDTIGEVNHFVFRPTFEGDDLRIIVDEVTGELKGLSIRARRTSTVR